MPEKMSRADASLAPYSQIAAMLQNPQYEPLLGLTSAKIRAQNAEVLAPLCATEEEWETFQRQAEGYRFIEEPAGLSVGAFVRWIRLVDPEHLTFQHCGIVCDIQHTGQGDAMVSCKNFMHRHYTFRMEECLVFQKLTPQEKMVLSVLDRLAEEGEDGDDEA